MSNSQDKSRMVRARKDSEGSHIEQYRKKIGKQDYKKSKSEIKEAKRVAEAKDNAPSKLKEILILLMAVCTVVLAVYAILYMLISPNANAN